MTLRSSKNPTLSFQIIPILSLFFSEFPQLFQCQDAPHRHQNSWHRGALRPSHKPHCSNLGPKNQSFYSCLHAGRCTCIQMYVYMYFIYVCLFIYNIYIYILYLFIGLSIYIYRHFSIHWFICSNIHLFIHVSICINCLLFRQLIYYLPVIDLPWSIGSQRASVKSSQAQSIASSLK